MMEKKYNIDITFKTPKPMGQEVGMKMWEYATHFRSTGPRTYRYSAVLVSTPVGSLDSALDYVTESLRNTLAEHGIESVEFLDIRAQVQ